MRLSTSWACFMALACLVPVYGANSQAAASERRPDSSAAERKLQQALEANVKAEWDAFKNQDKQAFADLLAEDFMAVEDDNQGMRNKSVAVAEVDRALVSNYSLFAVKVLPLNETAALVTYELTMQFPPRAQVRFKRVLVSEVWIKRNGKWKQRYYQETRVR